MKKIMLLFVACLVGCGIGSFITYRIMSLRSEKMSEDIMMNDIAGDILKAVYLRENRQDYLMKRLDSTILPHDVSALKGEYAKHPDAPYYLWRIKRYQDDFSIQFPPETKNILDAVSSKRPDNFKKIGNEEWGRTNSTDIGKQP